MVSTFRNVTYIVLKTISCGHYLSVKTTRISRTTNKQTLYFTYTWWLDQTSTHVKAISIIYIINIQTYAHVRVSEKQTHFSLSHWNVLFVVSVFLRSGNLQQSIAKQRVQACLISYIPHTVSSLTTFHIKCPAIGYNFNQFNMKTLMSKLRTAWLLQQNCLHDLFCK